MTRGVENRICCGWWWGVSMWMALAAGVTRALMAPADAVAALPVTEVVERSLLKSTALNPSLQVRNVVDIESARFDSVFNALVVVWHYDTAYLPGDACYGYVYGTDSALVWSSTPDTAAQSAWSICRFPGRDSVRIQLGEEIRFSSRYYVSVRLQLRSGGDWGPPSAPSESAFCAIETGPFSWEPVVFFRNTGEGDTVWAFNEKVALWHKPNWQGGINFDTIVVYRPAVTPLGFIPVSVGFSVRVNEANRATVPPFCFGIVWDSVPGNHTREDIGLYRLVPGRGWMRYHHASVSVDRNLVWVEGYFPDSDSLARGSDPLILMVDTVAPVCSVLTAISEPVMRGSSVIDSVRIVDNCANVVVSFLQARGDTAPVVSRRDTLWSLDTIYRTTISALNVQATAGARAVLVISDGVKSIRRDLSRQVYRAPAGDIQTPANRWTPLRTTAVLDTPAILPTMIHKITGGGYDNTLCRIFRWFDSTAVTENSTRPHTWVEYSASRRAVFELVPGKLMWIKTRTSQRIYMGNGVTVSLRDTVRITLPPHNWTDFALPFGGFFAEYLGDILNATGPLADSLQFYQWRLSGATYSANLVHAPKLAIDTFINPKFVLTSGPTEGYTVFNPLDVPVTLYIPPVCTGMSALQGIARMAGKQRISGSWAFVLRPRLEDGTELPSVVLGYAPRTGAVAVTTLPPSPSFSRAGVRIFDRLLEQRHGHVVWHQIYGRGISGELEFYNDDSGPHQLTVRVEATGRVDHGGSLVVRNPSHGTSQLVPVGGELVVSVSAGSCTYRVVSIGDSDYRSWNCVPLAPRARFRASPRSAGVALDIQFALPSGIEAIEYRLMDAGGREVRRETDRTGISAGMYAKTWNWDVGPGLYVLEVAARYTDGRYSVALSQTVVLSR